jgi:DNA-binding NtrC family response regulator
VETVDAPAEGSGTAGTVRLLRRLAVVHPPEAARAWWLEGTRHVLGRDAGPGGLALSDMRASRAHAELVFVPALNAWRLRDLGSRNGTFVDGRRTDGVVLAHGAVIRIGDTLLVFAEVPVRVALPLPQPAVGGSLALAATEQLADLAAPSDVPVLLTGPSGAGKEVMARRIHARSGRAGDFVPFNCAGLPQELAGSELFGYARGAFSGAAGPRAGLFQSADRGTLFLDEIADLPPAQQPMLLRALQEKRVRPVGADREVLVDVRTIAATHRDLDALEAGGEWRGDLLARLAGLRVEVPPLARRREEVLPLFRRFLGEGPPLTTAAAEALLRHDWPRNVRELQHLAAGVRLFAPYIEAIDADLLFPSDAAPASERSEDSGRPPRDVLLALFRQHGGNVAALGRALGKHRAQIYRWLGMYGISRADLGD